MQQDSYITKQIIDNIPANVYWLSKDGVFLGCNIHQLNILGLESSEEYVGKTYQDLYERNIYEKESIEMLRENDRKIMEQDSPSTLEETAVKKDGSKEYFLTIKSPLHDSRGKVIGLMGVSLNITEKKLAEDSLKEERLQKELQAEKVQAMKIVGANIAHELRTPLRSIICGSDAVADYFPDMLHGYELAKKAKLPVKDIFNRNIEFLKGIPERISREAASANTIIDMFLMNIKEVDLKQKDFSILSVAESIDQALSRYPFQGEQKSWVIWKKDNDFKFEGNQLLFEHIIFNLMKNALYYVAAANKGDAGRIYITLENGENENRIHFKDTGTGISKDVLPKIFDDFFSDAVHGTGIGLSFCRMAMKQMGGSIICESHEGEFTEFVLSFPVV
jgi:PAS domain S-box-containing protein